MSLIEKLVALVENWRIDADSDAMNATPIKAGKALGYLECADELDALMPAIRQAMIDAERYAWLRENLGQTVSHWFCTEGGCALDADIDAARATGEGEGNG